MGEISRYEKVRDYCKQIGLKCQNDLIAVVDYSSLQRLPLEVMSFGFYAIFLKESYDGHFTYGLSKYTYQNNSVIFVAPNQIFGIDSVKYEPSPSGYALLIHPDFLAGSPWADRIKQCSFFSYETNEALLVNEKEYQVLLTCLKNIAEELNNPIDSHTQQLVLSNLMVFFSYCTRPYDRQFHQRRTINNEIFERFNQVLEDYYVQGLPETLGLPTVSYCASQLSLSANYFGDLIKRVTGKSAKEHIQQVTIEHVKLLLANKKYNISEVAYKSGFKYPHHLSRVFKKITGLSPFEYRKVIRTSIVEY